MSKTTLTPPYTITIKVDAEGRMTTTLTTDDILPPTSPDYLSDHFTWTEALWSATANDCGIDNDPSEDECAVIEGVTAPFMEWVRQILDDKPIEVTSWYRCEELNNTVGGSATSEHLAGRAVDFVCPSFGTPYEICLTLAADPLLPFNQLIFENQDGAQWVHISCPPPGQTPKRDVLTIDQYGTHVGLVA